MNYLLGPMKCFGKQQLYPPEIDQLNKQMEEQKIIDVVNQANSKGLPKIIK